MPTTVVETDAFIASLQRPNNGELADAASILLYLQHLSNSRRWLYNRGRSALFDITRAPYSADPTGGVDSTTAIQNAINAAAVAGGDIFVPAGYFLHTGLTFPEGVDLYLAPRARLAINHASNDHITLSGAATYLPNLIFGGRFVGNITNSGTVVRASTANSKALVHGCSYNSPADFALEGRFGWASAAGSKIRFENCECDVAGAQRAYEASSGGAFEVVGGRLKMPATYATQLAYVNNGSRGDLEGVKIDLTAHTTGTAKIMTASSASRAAMRKCVVDATGMSGNVTGFDWSTAARVAAKGNEWEGSGALTVYGAALAAAGSDLELLPCATGNNGGTTYTIPSGYRAVAVYNTVTTSPTFTLPQIYFIGQELDLTIYNLSGNTWGFSLANYGFKGSQPTLTGVSGGSGASARFVAMDPTNTGTPSWVQIGAWATVVP